MGTETAAERLAKALEALRGNQPDEPLPWLTVGSEHVSLSTKIPNDLSVKLQWIADQMGISKRDVIEMALSSWVNEDLRRRKIVPR